MELTIEELKALVDGTRVELAAAGYAQTPYLVGENYFIRTVTYHYTGRLMAVYPGELVLTDAAWIASTGRWAKALSTGSLDEVEPYPDNTVCIISRSTVVDACIWRHSLPRSVS